MSATAEFKRVYVWELPVRFSHWINVLTIMTLIGTGIIIGNPPAIMSGSEASHSYWFGTVRFIHFTSAYIFTINLIVRFYWAFVGNRYAHWKQFFPFSKKARSKMKHVFKVDVFLQHDRTADLTNIAVGHNPVAAASYLVLFLLCIAQIMTGFALYSSNATWFFPKMFGWVIGVFGEEFTVRSIHHAVTWILVFFTLIHVYLVFYHDWLEGRGEVSSMFGGYKFVRKERLKERLIENIEDANMTEVIADLESEIKKEMADQE
jgi:Ni/Fe-hydrogenase 1 B-type cytochrome subunit